MSDAIFEYEVALSFAGEDRAPAEELFQALKAAGVPVFYDKGKQAELLGKDLTRHLHEVYCKKSRYCVPFISEHYARSDWTMLELRAALERALRERGTEYIIPVRLDDTEIPGLPSTLGAMHIDEGLGHICKLLLQKLGREGPGGGLDGDAGGAALGRLLDPGTAELPRYATVAHRLVARYEQVPFAGREAELAELERWARSEQQVAVRLLVGSGGMGKTRLLLEWVKRLNRAGERAGFVRGPLMRVSESMAISESSTFRPSEVRRPRTKDQGQRGLRPRRDAARRLPKAS